MEKKENPKKKDFNSVSHRASSIFATIAIPVEFIICLVVFNGVMGNPANFIDGNLANNPLSGNYLGIVYKGGYVVPILMTLFLVVVTFFLERLWTLRQAKGKQNPAKFVAKVKQLVASQDIEAAIKECDLQCGSLANIIRAGLEKYQEMGKNGGLTSEKKALALQKALEEAGAMETPILERNLAILSTIASIATLMGLFGTVLGMVKAFAALANAGAPDAVALANGISEALVNTALGIGTSALAIVFYNYCTTRIDHIVYLAAEAGQAIVHTFSLHHNDK